MRGVLIRLGMGTAIALVAVSGSASAATLEVTRTDDPAPGACAPRDCSLREAVRRANASPGPDRIVLRARTYLLQRAGADDDALAGDLDVLAGGLAIAGKGRRRTAIDGNQLDRILDVAEGAGLTVVRVTLRRGEADTGGAIENDGRTVLRRAAVRANSSVSQGGGIYNDGTGQLRVLGSVIVGNDGERGGGIWSENEGVASIVRSRISGNRASADGGDGGGIVNQNEARMFIGRSTIAGNSAIDDGGGIFNQNDAQLTIVRSTVSGNRTLDTTSGGSFARGGGIFHQNNAVLVIRASTISGNQSPTGGGGIFAQNNSVMTLTNSTISGNRADEGGGLYVRNFATVRLSFSTLGFNRAVSAGGGIFEATGIPNPAVPQPPYLLPRGTIAAGNVAPASPNCFVTNLTHWDSLGSNLENGATCPFDAAGDRRNARAGLRKLARNGGPTRTHALKRTSGALNAAPRKGCPKRDQRGIKRPQGRRCDIGSYERKRRRRASR